MTNAYKIIYGKVTVKMNWGDKIERICAVLVCILTAVCILPVWAVSIVWTQSFWNETSQEYTDVFMFRIRDGIKFNLLFCIVALFLFTMICVGARRMKQWQITALIALEAVAVVIFCGVYNWQLRPIQWADYSQIVSIAGAFVRGDFSQFTPGAYLATYPHQLGLICLVMGIIKLVGGANAIPTFQILNCFCAGGILVFGYRIVHCIWQRKEIDLIYGLIQGMCLPLYFYTGLVYGEIISIMLLLVGMEQMVRMCCQKRVTWQRAGVMLLSLGLAVAFRKNSLVVFIAMGIVLLIVMLKEKYWKLMLLYLVLFGGVLYRLFCGKESLGRSRMKELCPLPYGFT